MAQITKKLPLLVQSEIKIAVSQLILSKELAFQQQQEQAKQQEQMVQYIVLDQQGEHVQFQEQTSDISTGVQNVNLETPKPTEDDP